VATTNDIKNGTVLKLEGNLWNVIEFQHVKPGKGGAFVRTKMRNITSGKVVDKTFNAGAKVETATVDRSEYQYLYQDGADYVFMDTKDYDQITVPGEVVGDAANFLLESMTATIAMHEGSPLYIELPASVVLEITYTEPGLQGDRSTGGTKPATVETGYQIQVPLFLEVTYTEPGLQGDRSTGGTKPATVETGATVNVPLFITTGEKIKVDTRDGRYLGRS
jgi:elongation factor P